MGIAFNQVQLHILEIPDGWVPKPSWTASIQVWWGIYILINKHAEDGMLVRKGYQHVNNAIIDFLPSHNQHQLSYYIRLDPPFNTLKSYLCCYSAKWYMVVWDCPMGVDNVCQDAIPRTFKCGLCVYVCVCVRLYMEGVGNGNSSWFCLENLEGAQYPVKFVEEI